MGNSSGSGNKLELGNKESEGGTARLQERQRIRPGEGGAEAGPLNLFKRRERASGRTVTSPGKRATRRGQRPRMRIYCGWGSDLIPHSEVTGRGSDLVGDSEVVQTVTYPPESEDTGRNSDPALMTDSDFALDSGVT